LARKKDLTRPDRLKTGDGTGARASFEESLRFNGHDSSAYLNLGLLALASGDRPAAANYFTEALWLDPQSENAQQGLLKTQQPTR